MKNKNKKQKRGQLLWLKDHFIPHAGNNHRPHLLHRHKTLRLFLISYRRGRFFPSCLCRNAESEPDRLYYARRSWQSHERSESSK